jgi:hypothetical protein
MAISLSLEIGLILRLEFFILVHRISCNCLRVFVKIMQRTMGEKMYIILGKFLSKNFLNTCQFKAKII